MGEKILRAFVIVLAGVAIACIAVGTAVLAIKPARAQGLMCAEKQKMIAYLAARYGEIPAGGGILTTGQPLLMLARPDGKSFTFLILLADGKACLTATGSGFSVAAPEPGKGT